MGSASAVLGLWTKLIVSVSLVIGVTGYIAWLVFGYAPMTDADHVILLITMIVVSSIISFFAMSRKWSKISPL